MSTYAINQTLQSQNTIVTIAELRSAHIARNQSRRKAYMQAKQERIKAQWQHAEIIRDMLDRLAVCYGLENTLTIQDVYSFYESYKWACAYSATWHNADTPLNVYFVTPLDANGRIEISNMKPRYYANWLQGEYRLNRGTIEFYPPTIAPIDIAMGA